MKALTALLVFSAFNSIAQLDSLDYKWKESGFTPGFYSTYLNVKERRPVHTGPFETSQRMTDCRYNHECLVSYLNISSKIKADIWPLDIKYVYDGKDLFVVYKTIGINFGTVVEVDAIQNSGRFCFFERLIESNQNGVKPAVRHLIIDLKTDTILKPSKKNMALLFEDNMDLLNDYQNDLDQRKLLKHLILLNQRLGYLSQSEK